MGSNGGDEVLVSRSDGAECSEATVEIKIKTLDSQTYTLRVDKCMPVPALKEQIATVTGVLSEQQRLICRGKVLKDDQLLSAYHVEDGHTLHLVVRQPIPLSSESLLDHTATDPAASASRGQGNQSGPSVVVGTFNISEQGDGVLPDLSRIVSAVLSSFGVANVGSSSNNEGGDMRERFGLGVHSLGSLRDSGRQQPDQAAARAQHNPFNGSSPLSTAVPLEALQPPVIPDSLTTLSQYLCHMRNEFSASVGHNNNSQAAGNPGTDEQESNAPSYTAAGQGGLPTPASLAEVLLSTRQMFIEQAGECLSQLARQLQDHTNVIDPSIRASIQSNAMRSGDLFQKLGALLFELGRTTMTLRMGQGPADAVVNAGPAVFISTAGPNPIMVQPLPFQPGTSFGAFPLGTTQPGSGFSTGNIGSGFLPRNIDIRIRTGSLMPTAIVNHGELSDAQQSPGQNNAESPGHAHFVSQAAPVSGNSSSTRDSEVRVVPLRTVVAAVPAPVRRAPSDSPRSAVGLFYPVLARVQHVTSARGSHGSEDHHPNGLATELQPVSESTVQQANNAFPETDGNTASAGGVQDDQAFSTQMHGRLDQLLRTLFPNEQIHVGDVNFQGAASNTATGHMGAPEMAAGAQEVTPGVTDEGIFLSNILQQIMPYISQSTGMGLNNASPDRTDMENRTAYNSSTQTNSCDGTSSSRHRDPSSPNSKRQKRE